MYVNVTLYKTKLSTTDTMVFSSKEEQTEFFNGLTKLDLGQCSFNGKRTIRINGNYFMLNIGGYNYIKIYYTDGNGNERTYYAFIDLFRYVNDNCCEVDVTTDYIQTYMFDIQFSQLFIEQRNYSLDSEDLLSLSYKNYYPSSIYNNIKEDYICVKDTSDDSKYEFNICVLLNASTPELSNLKNYTFNIPLNEYKMPKSINTNSSIVCFVFPCTFKNGSITEVTSVNYDDKVTELTYKLNDFISKYGANIVDVFIADTLQCVKELNNNTIVVDTLTSNYINVITLDEKTIITIKSMQSYVRNENVIKEVEYNYHKALFRSPYYNIYVGRDGGTMSLINPYDLDLSNGLKVSYDYYQDILPVYNSIVKVLNTKRKYDCIFTFPPILENFLFSVDAWSQYKLTHSASVGDSLSTKHAYDIEIAERNRENAKDIATSKFGASGAQTAGNLIGSLAGGLLSVDPLKRASQIIGGIGSTIGNTVGGGITYAQELENAEVAYQNTLTTIEQESALLRIQYNDIKNSPATVNNMYSGGTYVYGVNSVIKLNLLEPNNINEIIKYHKRFGFETALQTEITDLAGLHDTKAQHFDYIRTLNCSVISENIPRTSAEIIQKIFNSGIYLWRNYEKLGEDYLSNYEGE